MEDVEDTFSPKISVIVPIYGVEKFIARCARSLFSQTMSDVEFIFIDDCTPDRSMYLLDSVIEEYSPFFLDKKWTVIKDRMAINSGLPAVREKGIKLAKGVYIAHVDSDDWVEPEMLESLYYEAEKGNFNVVFGDFYKDNGSKRSIVPRFSFFDNNPHTIMKRIMMAQEYGCVWSAIYLRDLYNNSYTIPPMNMGEDLTFNIQWLYLCNKAIGWYKKPVYHYFYNENSISKDESPENIERKFIQLNKNVDVLNDFFRSKNVECCYEDGLISLRLWACRPLTPLLMNDKYYHLWREKIDSIKGQILFNSGLSINIRIHFVLSWLRLTPILSKVKKN